MKVTFYPDVKESDLGSGLISVISWERLKPHLETAFVLKPNERLVGIEISDSGIAAKFETINPQP